jgi:hypothetical protein
LLICCELQAGYADEIGILRRIAGMKMRQFQRFPPRAERKRRRPDGRRRCKAK